MLINKSKLIELIDEETVSNLERLFKDSYDEIILRRASAIARFISPHIDHSLKTMQVSLNS